MPDIQKMLRVHNEQQTQLKLRLEPIPEYFTLKPNQQVEVHAIFDEKSHDHSFSIGQSENSLIVYMPGYLSLKDSYVMCDGVRLVPDGH